MKQRGLVHVLGALVGGMLVGCGSSDPSSDASQSDSVASADFDGVYRPTSGAGDIATIAFKAGHGYLMMPTGCSSEGCTQVGTYTLDPARTLLTLTDSKTGNQRVIDIRVLETSPANSLRTQDIVTPTQLEQGQPQLAPGKPQLAQGQQKLDQNAEKLVDAIKSFLMNGNSMAQQNTGDTGNNDGNNGNGGNTTNAALHAVCSQPAPAGVMPTGNATQAELDSYFQVCTSGPNTGA
jgi:hypothetical protein